MASSAILALDSVSAGYRRLPVLRNIKLDINEGESVAVLGANGSGKTTLLRAISGIIANRTGSIRLGGREIVSAQAHEIVSLGVAHVPENRHLFGTLPVSENLSIGALPLHRKGLRSADTLAFVLDLFPRLAERSNQLASTLSGGEQQMLAIARALMSRPRVLLLDEPSVGLAPKVINELVAALQRLRTTGLTILIAEQNVPLALNIAQRAAVLHLGGIALAGTAEDLRSGDQLRGIYLGGSGSNRSIEKDPQ